MSGFLKLLLLAVLALSAPIAMADNNGGSGSGSGGGSGSGSGAAGGQQQQQQQQQQQTQMVTLSREDLDKLIADAAKGKNPKNEPDPTLDAIERDKKAREKDRETQGKIVSATKFNVGFDIFLKEYAGVLPPDATEIAKVASSDKYESEVDRSLAIKAALIQSFFKEEENVKLLSDSQKAKWKAYQALGTVGRQEEAATMYEVVFEPAINQARAIRQAQISSKQDTYKGSKDSDIIFKKVQEKQLRSLKNSYTLNDVLHDQAKSIGLVGSNS